MTTNEYKAMIEASGGVTPEKAQGKGDRPQPLTAEDELLLAKSWKKASISAKARGKVVKAEEEKSAYESTSQISSKHARLGPIKPIIITGGSLPAPSDDSPNQITIDSQYITFKVDVGEDDAWTESENVSNVVNVNQIVYGSQEYTLHPSDHPISIEFKNMQGHIFTVAENNETAQTTIDITVDGSTNNFQIQNPLPNQEWMSSEFSDANATFYKVEIKNQSGQVLARLEGGDADVTIYVEESGSEPESKIVKETISKIAKKSKSKIAEESESKIPDNLSHLPSHPDLFQNML